MNPVAASNPIEKHVSLKSQFQIADWENPHWQFKNSFSTLADFKKWFVLSPEEEAAFSLSEGLFRIRVTPYYASLANSTNPRDPIRKILLPTSREHLAGTQTLPDPLSENRYRPTSRIIHRYPDRCLFLVTDFCSVYCRYCTRKHFTGKDQVFPKADEYLSSLEYIRKTKTLREVILSGGDPLTLSDERILKILTDLKTIPHLDLIRIGTRIPLVNPYRITKALCEILKAHSPIYMMLHFNHPREVTPDAAQALNLLADHGIVLLNQMVLLNGVNNHPAVVHALSRRLLKLRVKPYYMFQCDPSPGTDHLRTSVEHSEWIQRELWGRVSGLAMPNLSLDIPDGGGKVGLVPNFEISRENGLRKYKGWDGELGEYKNPSESMMLTPSDVHEYLEDWEGISSK